MSKADFKFIGIGTNSGNTTGPKYIAYLTGKANGLDSTSNGGYAAVGSAGLHAGLSDNALTNAGTYYRAWNFSDDATGNGDTNNVWSGQGFLATSSLGELLNPASGSLFNAANRTNGKPHRAAISLRATVRLNSASGNASGATKTGAAIGIFFGSRIYSNTENFSHSDEGNVADHTDHVDTSSGSAVPGYNLLLSSLYHCSNHDGQRGRNTGKLRGKEGVRLLFMANPQQDKQTNSTNYDKVPDQGRHLRPVPGTYSMNTWYRIRMDITILPGTHIIDIYTADNANVAPGSESWTKQLTEYIYACQMQFVRTIGANNGSTSQNHRGMGYTVESFSSAAASSEPRHSAYIDNFEVLAEELEDSQPNN